MFEFITNSPPETTLLLGLAVGALVSDAVKKVANRAVERVAARRAE